jgi:hypothetical protein
VKFQNIFIIMAQGNKKQNTKTPAMKSKVKQKGNQFKRRGSELK